MQKFGIDTSRWQGDFDFAKAKTDEGVEFAIIKIGGADDGYYKDSQFDSSYEKCKACGLPVGVFFFGHAMNMEQAKSETAYLLELLRGKQLEYPVFYDVEADMLTLGTRSLTDICKYVLSTVQAAGWWVGIYTSESHFNEELIDSELTEYSHWAAKYSGGKPNLTSGAELQMWQFGGTKNEIRSNLINGQVVDQNYCYIDYPAKIKANGLNGYAKSSGELATSQTGTQQPAPETKPAGQKPASQGAQQQNGISAGQQLTLKNTALYNSETGSTAANRLTGTYFAWSSEVINGRIKITNRADRVGVKGQVTGFINLSDISGQTAEAKPAEQKPASPGAQQQNGINAGQQLTLSNTALYNSETSSTAANRLTGTYFAWSSEVINGRIKITNRADRVGVKGQVTGFINLSDI